MSGDISVKKKNAVNHLPPLHHHYVADLGEGVIAEDAVSRCVEDVPILRSTLNSMALSFLPGDPSPIVGLPPG